MNAALLRRLLVRLGLVPYWTRLLNWFSSVEFLRTAAWFNRGVYYHLQETDHDTLRRLLKSDYYVILTRRRAHLTTYLIGLLSWFGTGARSHYSHALMNCEGDIDNNIDFKLVEAVGVGTRFSTFMQVFDVDSVVLLKPRGIELALWTAVLDKLKASLGTPYDDLFDLTNSQNMSCVELVFLALQQFPSYETLFPNLVNLIATHGNSLTPQMMFDCGDFDIVFEARR